MNVKYMKRAKGGYYAFVPVGSGGAERCIIVHGEDGTGRVGANQYWVAKAYRETVIGNTRKEAVEAMVEHMGWSK